MSRIRKQEKKYFIIIFLCIMVLFVFGKKVKVDASANTESKYREIFNQYMMAAMLSDKDGDYPYSQAYCTNGKNDIDAVTALNYTALSMKNLSNTAKKNIPFEDFCKKYVYSNQYGRFSSGRLSIKALKEGVQSSRALRSPLFTYDKTKDQITVRNGGAGDEMRCVFLGSYEYLINMNKVTTLYGVWKNAEFPGKTYGYIALQIQDSGSIGSCYEVRSDNVKMDVDIYEDDFDSNGEPDGEIIYTIGDSKKEVLLPCKKEAYSQCKFMVEGHELSVEPFDIKISTGNKNLIQVKRKSGVYKDSLLGSGKTGTTNITCTVKSSLGDNIFTKIYSCTLYELSIFKNGVKYNGEEFKVTKGEKVRMSAQLKGLEKHKDIFSYYWWISGYTGLTNVRGKSIEFTALKDSKWDKVNVRAFYKGKVYAFVEEELNIKLKDQGLKKETVIKDKKTKAAYKVTGNNTVQYSKPAKKTKTATIPATITVKGAKYQVTSVAAKAFANNKKLKKVIIPASVRSIGKQAFSGCKNLKMIVIKTKYLTKKSVGNKAFKGIYAKAKIIVPKKQKKTYKKLLKTKGVGKNVKIK